MPEATAVCNRSASLPGAPAAEYPAASIPVAAPRIAILVVAYNAESTLAAVLDRIPQEILAKVAEIIVFDDASEDNTYAIGEEYRLRSDNSRISVFRNAKNLMYGGNQRRGYRYAIERGYDIVVLLHGDGQYAPDVMQRLLTPIESGKADMVMGSRMMVPGAARAGNMPAYKYHGNRILTWLENTLTGANLTEFHSGYRAYSVHALKTIPLDEMTWNWHFDTQIILEFMRQGYRIVEVPIPTYYGDEICRVNGVPYALNCIREALRYALRYRWRTRGALPSTRRSRE